MRLLLDESIPRRLADHLTGVEVDTVYDRNWSGLKNGELLRNAGPDYNVFVTADQNLQYQQNLKGFRIGVAVLAARTNRLQDLLLLVPELLRLCGTLAPGEVRVIRMSPDQAKGDL